MGTTNNNQQLALAAESFAAYLAPHGNDHAGLAQEVRSGGTIPSKRMRLLHFENTFGDVYTSEYCHESMLSLVLLMTKNAKPDTDRLERLTATADAAPSAKEYPCASAQSAG